MKLEDVQVGVNYFGRTVTSVTIHSEDPPRGVVWYTTKDDPKDDKFAFFREFCSWLNVKRGGEPTDPWHAMCLRIREKGLNARKRVEIDGKAYRMRRGKLVEIPPEWVGKTTHPQAVRKRASKKNQGRRFKRKAMR